MKSRQGLVLISSMLCLVAAVFYSGEKTPYDVIVLGSDPEGISAAVSARRQGEKVLLIDTRDEVGGLYTSGMLSMLDLNYRAFGSADIVNEGFYREFYDAVGEEANIDVEKTKKYFQTLLRSEQVDIILRARHILPLRQGRRIVGVSYIKEGRSYRLPAKVVIEATPDVPFSRKAGVDYVVGREDMGLGKVCAATTLVFSVKDVNWEKVKSYLNNDDSVHTGANNKVAWGYPEMLTYVPTSEDFQLRRLNLSLQDNGEVVINAFQIFHVNALAPRRLYESYEKAIKELPYIVEFLNKRAIGFEDASLSKYAKELYVREGVRIKGAYTLKGEDLFTNSNFPDKVAYGSYPTDLQATKRDGIGGTVLSSRSLYTLPLSIMVPQKLEGLLVVGRSMSMDSIAHSSARTVPVGMAMGQAAGIVASYSIQEKQRINEIIQTDSSIRKIQQTLRYEGVLLDLPIQEPQDEKKSWAYKHIVSLRGKGLVSKEYHNLNDYRCQVVADEETMKRQWQLLIANGGWELPKLDDIMVIGEILEQEEIVVLMNKLTGILCANLEEMKDLGIISEETYQKVYLHKNLLNEDVYAILDEVLQKVKTNKRKL
ncbi:hypothetical protein CS063_03175 [Sporanaerobium hydrogeniformans]|uniref:Uncharacterized protein n=1 Tax=Sporanaerobium hydrogeniformans TaxID=3072179 RepID=A0AC61DEJ0_9FIRM|nr:FAD-dependent oxidoreductase [Sporanaerobium hydrogeniformans]PHV71581.1 hypothetical protein CS063_03175 [Sporanaerobium hydrogeniformans]